MKRPRARSQHLVFYWNWKFPVPVGRDAGLDTSRQVRGQILVRRPTTSEIYWLCAKTQHSFSEFMASASQLGRLPKIANPNLIQNTTKFGGHRKSIKCSIFILRSRAGVSSILCFNSRLALSFRRLLSRISFRGSTTDSYTTFNPK